MFIGLLIVIYIHNRYNRFDGSQTSLLLMANPTPDKMMTMVMATFSLISKERKRWLFILSMIVFAAFRQTNTA